MRGCEAFPSAVPILFVEAIEDQERQRAISGRRWGALLILLSSAALWLGAWQIARLVF